MGIQAGVGGDIADRRGEPSQENEGGGECNSGGDVAASSGQLLAAVEDALARLEATAPLAAPLAAGGAGASGRPDGGPAGHSSARAAAAEGLASAAAALLAAARQSMVSFACFYERRRNECRACGCSSSFVALSRSSMARLPSLDAVTGTPRARAAVGALQHRSSSPRPCSYRFAHCSQRYG